MDMAYKIYAYILNKKLEKERKKERRKSCGKHSFQERKRNNGCTLVYTLKYVVSKELCKNGEKLLTFLRISRQYLIMQTENT